MDVDPRLLKVVMLRSSRGIVCVERAWKMRVQEEEEDKE